MTKTTKPALVPTLVSSQLMAWSVLLLAFFALALWVYFTLDAIKETERLAAEPVSTTVEGEGITCEMPKGWKAYFRTANGLRLRRSAGETLPYIAIESPVDVFAPYHAIDLNPALVLRRLENRIAESLGAGERIPRITLHGLEQTTVKPGVRAIRFVYSTDDGGYGMGCSFYCGQRRYSLWGGVRAGDEAGRRDLVDFMNRPFETMHLPEAIPEIDRPIIDSSHFTPEENNRTLQKSERELAMWRLFADRVKAEPASALLPALVHFREAVRLLSSIRQERGLLESEDFRRYRKLLEARRAEIAEWHVLLDKYRAMGDNAAARAQANYIIDHATLKGEGHDLRRARDVLDDVDREEAAAAAKK